MISQRPLNVRKTLLTFQNFSFIMSLIYPRGETILIYVIRRVPKESQCHTAMDIKDLQHTCGTFRQSTTGRLYTALEFHSSSSSVRI